MRVLAPLLLLAAAASPLAAQFEGSIHMKMASSDNAPLTEMTYYIKGSHVAYTMSSPMMPGTEMRIIMDQTTMKSTMLMPLSGEMAGAFASMPGMADAKGIMIEADMAKLADMAGGKDAMQQSSIKALGTTQMIAGYKCEDYDATDGKTVVHMCLAQGLGKFAFGGSGGRGGKASAGPSWMRGMDAKMGFPLKVVMGNGKVAMEATSVTKGPVADAMFTVPAGYKPMPNMGAMMGGGRGGN
jgi:Domain of unknown function (DUF4412)